MEIASGPWDLAKIESFLDETRIPLRLATNGREFPLVQSLWFAYDAGSILCCTQTSAVVAARLARDPRCAFEVAGDSPPYRGVRGRGVATLETEGCDDVLGLLIDRYLDDRQSDLAQWLMSRIGGETVLRISELTVNSWDYSGRMP